MSKISLIIQREYISRVKKKSFIIMTFLTPVLMALVVILPAVIISHQEKDLKNIAVIDESKQFVAALKSNESVKFDYLKSRPDTLQKFLQDKEYYAILVIPQNYKTDTMFIYSEQAIAMEVKENITRQINAEVELQNLLAQNIDPQVIMDAKEHVPLQTLVWSKDGKLKKSMSEVNMFMGLIAAFIIYMFIFIYGSQLMRGTMEEKTGRVVELLLSSVKPLHIMFGKIIGIAAVAITQFGLWVILLLLFMSGIKVFYVEAIPPEISTVLLALKNVNPVMWGSLFLTYFIGGYLLYGSMFAAVGAAVENETDTQQFTLPITLPLILALIFAQSVITNPDGPLAVWMSIIPFTSPLVMMVRIGFGVPFWQVGISVALLIATFVVITYFVAKIYRIGILAYGKKVSYKDLWKWIRYKN